MASRISFVAGRVVFRNTWKNERGHIRTNLYDSAKKAEASAGAAQNGALYQEIATPVRAEECLINPSSMESQYYD